MSRRLLSIVCFLLFFAESFQAANPIGINFQGRQSIGPDTPTDPLRPNEIAGVLPQANWNNINDMGYGRGESGTSSFLRDSAGVATGVSITFTANDSWNNDTDGIVSGNARMMNGVIKASAGTIPLQFRIDGLSPGLFDIYVYLTVNYDGTQVKVYDADRIKTFYLTEGHQFTDSTPFVEASNTDSSIRPLGNYVRFRALDSQGRSSISVMAEHLVSGDGVGVSGIQILRLSDSPATKPLITSDPLPLVLEQGSRADFSVSAVGTATLTYQWYKDETLLTGKTGSALTIASVTPSDFGNYWVVVQNGYGSAESAHVSLSLPPTPTPVQVTTIAGNGTAGYLDSSLNPLAAQFAGPDGGAVNGDGVIFIGDAANQVIRFIMPSGVVGTWTGSAGVAGYQEGLAGETLFNLPLGLALDSSGDLLIADYGNHRVRRVLSTGYRASALLAGNGTAGFLDGMDAKLNGPNDLVALGGQIFFTEFFNHTIRRIDPAGKVWLLAGGSGASGYRDGQGPDALFNGPAGITAMNGNLYVTDWFNNRIRKITLSGLVTTIAGSGVQGFKNGLRTAAQIGTPNGIVADAAGNLYFTEKANSAVRKIDPTGWVDTLAGIGVGGFADGDRDHAMFNQPGGIALHPDGSLIVFDTYNYRIRRIVLDGKTNGWSRSQGLLTIDTRPVVNIYGEIGDRYRIESRDSLGLGGWTPVTSVTLEQTSKLWLDERPQSGQQRLYRAIKE